MPTQNNIFSPVARLLRPVLIFIVFPLLLAVCPASSFAEPFQVFIPPSDYPLKAGQAYALDVWVLDKEGQAETSFTGQKQLQVTLLAPENQTLADQLDVARVMEFQQGQGLLPVKAKVAHRVVLDVRVAGVPLAGMVTIDFCAEDVLPPVVERVEIQGAKNMAVFFNEVVDEDSARIARHYLLKTNIREIHPHHVEYHQTWVVLFFAEVFDLEGQEGCIALAGLKDLSGNVVAEGYQTETFKMDCGCVD